MAKVNAAVGRGPAGASAVAKSIAATHQRRSGSNSSILGTENLLGLSSHRTVACLYQCLPQAGTTYKSSIFTVLTIGLQPCTVARYSRESDLLTGINTALSGPRTQVSALPLRNPPFTVERPSAGDGCRESLVFQMAASIYRHPAARLAANCLADYGGPVKLD